MKPKLNILDHTDPEFKNSDLSKSDLQEISLLLQKRKAAKTKIFGAKASAFKLVRK